MSSVTVSRNQRIVELYESGLTLQAVGDQFSLTRERVRQILDEMGARRRPKARPYAIAAAEAVAAGDGEVSVKEAAEAFGAESSNVRAYLRRHHPDFDYAAKRRAAIAAAVPHGTRNRYTTYGCRCRECRNANTQSTVIIPVDVFEHMRQHVPDVRVWATSVIREAAKETP